MARRRKKGANNVSRPKDVVRTPEAKPGMGRRFGLQNLKIVNDTAPKRRGVYVPPGQIKNNPKVANLLKGGVSNAPKKAATTGWRKPAPKVTATTPAVAGASALPYDSIYEQQNALIRKRLADQEASINSSLSDLKRSYGLEDTSDPFSQGQQLRRSYDTARRTTSASAAANNHLYSGSTQRAQDENRYQYEKSYDTLSKDYSGQSNQLSQRLADAKNEAQLQGEEALSARLKRAVANRVDPNEVTLDKANPANSPAVKPPHWGAPAKPTPTGRIYGNQTLNAIRPARSKVRNLNKRPQGFVRVPERKKQQRSRWG